MGAKESRHLAVHPADHDRDRNVPRRASVAPYYYYVIIGPVGAYYKEGMNPVKILATDKHVRAVKGGLGAAKTTANYAASLYAAEEAQKAGLHASAVAGWRRAPVLDEVGTMNIMVRIGDEIMTPPFGGAILAGITRDSVLTLLREWGMRVWERQISIEEVLAAAKAGRLEMWGTGTAAVISPVGEFGYKGERDIINDGKTGTLTTALRYDRGNSIRCRAGPAWVGAVGGGLSGAAWS